MGNVKHAFTSGKADGGDATQVRPSNWNAAHTGAVEILDRDLTQVDVANNAAETSIYSFSVPAGVMGADGGVRLKLAGDMLCNVAGTIRFIVNFGATEILATGLADPDNSNQLQKWTMEVVILNSAVAVQKCWAEMAIVEGTANFAVIRSNQVGMMVGRGLSSATEDTLGALVLEVTVNWSVASANLSFRKEMALLELIPAA
ncbi:hypothetical protein LCGC14_1118710 [marine sediment metagenome]|uniref:Uncharacterized protein n=1 Tax=marine sediment metagenome TaxID=412755 RepID=A0A0F9QAH5_9ZZZZ